MRFSHLFIPLFLLHLPPPSSTAITQKQDGTATTKTFNHINSEIRAEEAEEIGVEHLLRDVKDISVGTLSTRISNQLNSLKGLQHRLEDIKDYLTKVVAGELPVNHQIVYNLQNIFNLMPNLNVPEVARAFAVTTNDQLLVVYVSSLIRSVIALHNLINNKLENRDAEHKENQPFVSDKEKKETKAGDGKEGEKKESTATASSPKKKSDK